MAADLQQFNKLFTELEDRVIALDKREAEATRNVKTAEARYAFLKGEIYKLEQKRDTIIEASAVASKEAHDARELARQKLADTEAKHVKLKSQHEQSIRDLTNRITGLQRELKEVNVEIQVKRTLNDGLFSQSTNLKGEILELQASIGKKKTEIEQIDENLVKQQAKADEALIVIRNDLQSAENALSQLDDRIDKARSELEGIEEQTTVANERLLFTEQASKKLVKRDKERATALDARESSIAEQERQLEVRLITSRRRRPVLDNSN